MVYSKKMDEIYGETMYPKSLPTVAFSITPTLKEVVTSRGIVTEGVKRMGIKIKGTHFKLDTPIGKLGIKEISVIHARDDGDFTNIYTHRYSVLAIPLPKQPRKK
jgi:hypothetical protein